MNDFESLLLLGCGGHALVVAEAAQEAGFTIHGFLDDDPETKANAGSLGHAFLGSINDAAVVIETSSTPLGLHAAVGNNELREAWMKAARSAGLKDRFLTIVHPRAIVSPSANLGLGSFIGPNAVINARARIGEGVIVNTSAVVEHDCVIGAYSHVAPNATLGGGAQVGDSSLIGLGAIVLPRITIGQRVVVGAGAVVVGDLPDDVVAHGVPAKIAQTSHT
ncbi:MAG: acetyltransferase [Planctomycetota bacterium]|nr:acetyltransferase [Planctomycetota bacterium]